jgi:hypothetical protein
MGKVCVCLHMEAIRKQPHARCRFEQHLTWLRQIASRREQWSFILLEHWLPTATKLSKL